MQPTETSHEHEPVVVDHFVVLDMDRTLLTTDSFLELVYEVLESDYSSDKIDQIREHLKATKGKGVEPLAEIRARLGDINTDYIESGLSSLYDNEPARIARTILQDGATELVRALELKNTPYGVLTYGGKEAQDMKLLLLRKALERPELPAKVLEGTTTKTQLIEAEWWDPELGLFAIPEEVAGKSGLYAANIWVLDDKLENTKSDHDFIHGRTVVEDNQTAHEHEYHATLADLALEIENGQIAS